MMSSFRMRLQYDHVATTDRDICVISITVVVREIIDPVFGGVILSRGNIVT